MLVPLGNLGSVILISNHPQPLHPVPTEDPSASTSLALQVTPLQVTGAVQLLSLRTQAKARGWLRGWGRGSVKAGHCENVLGLVLEPSLVSALSPMPRQESGRQLRRRPRGPGTSPGLT